MKTQPIIDKLLEARLSILNSVGDLLYSLENRNELSIEELLAAVHWLQEQLDLLDTIIYNFQENEEKE